MIPLWDYIRIATAGKSAFELLWGAIILFGILLGAGSFFLALHNVQHTALRQSLIPSWLLISMPIWVIAFLILVGAVLGICEELAKRRGKVA